MKDVDLLVDPARAEDAKRLMLLRGWSRDHALPDDVQALAPSVLPHRLLLAADAAGEDRADIVRDALERVPAL